MEILSPLCIAQTISFQFVCFVAICSSILLHVLMTRPVVIRNI